jgi:hypothetical protein
MNMIAIVPIAISFLALIVSLMSWHESRVARQVARASSRASIHLGPARLMKVGRGGGEIELTIQNAGASMAKRLEIYTRSLVLLTESDKAKSGHPYIRSDDTVSLHALAPGRANKHTVVFELPADGLTDQWPTLLGVSVRINYEDEASGSNFETTDFFTGLAVGLEVLTPDMTSGSIPPPHALDEWKPGQHPRER